MDKVIRDGNVAVLVSPGYGAGWSTWSEVNVFEPRIVNAIMDGASLEELTEIAEELYPEAYCGGLEDVVVQWIPEGTLFRIEEYDGSESLVTMDTYTWDRA